MAMGLSSLGGGLMGAVGGGGGLTYSSVQSKYQDFGYPQAEILLGNTPFASKGEQMIINDISVELTSGFEASIARFRIYNVFDSDTGKFKYEAIKKQVILGTSLTIKLGYVGVLKTVFVGFVAEVNFGFDPSDLPYIEVTGMDVKGIMMANNYSYQLTAKNYGDAVEEVLRRTAYEKLRGGASITDIKVTATPDKKSGSPKAADAFTIEMVSESDYEFVVKAAKKFNYEFFTECGTVFFRKAKSNKSKLMTLKVGAGIISFDVRYSITGLVQSIEARAMDVGNGKLITSKSDFSNNVSTKGTAKGLFGKTKKVYIDPSINSQEDADARVASLMETMSYRLGELDCQCVGIPELLPGYFIELDGLGSPVDNTFYLTSVIHEYGNQLGYRTKIKGKTAEVKK